MKRQLLSHSSGLAYSVTDPLLTRFRLEQGRPIEQGFDNVEENFTFPMISDPGTDWSYSPGLDWCTRLIARASKKPAEAYLQAHMTKPLGVEPWEMTFNPLEYPEAHARHADTVLRAEDGSLTHDDTTKYWDRVEEPSGGQGIFCTTRAYMEALFSILANDGRLLKPETRNLLFEPALTPESENGLRDYIKRMRSWHVGKPIPLETAVSHSVGGLMPMEDCDPEDPEAWRRKGSLMWAGMTNTFWVSNI